MHAFLTVLKLSWNAPLALSPRTGLQAHQPEEQSYGMVRTKEPRSPQVQGLWILEQAYPSFRLLLLPLRNR
jgi:hypothetical protein